MRSKIDARIDRRAAKKKTRPPFSGKVLRRLFFYLNEREPALNTELAATLALPKSALPKFAFAKTRTGRAAKAAAVPKKRGRRRAASPVAKSFATAIAKAATQVARPPRRAQTARARKAGPPPAPSAAAWQFIGPSRIPEGQTYGTNRIDVIGRLSSIAVDPKNPKHVLVGAAGGGIWESGDTGSTWKPRSDQLPSLAIGAIAFDPKAPKTVYAGSGEGNFYANLGAGVFRSTDGGTTWAVLASAPFVGIGFYDLTVDPQNTKFLYAATTNGFYKSTNGGSTWSQKRAVKCWDLSVHPGGGTTEILAAFEDGLFVSTNTGDSFSPVTLPFAPTTWSRLAVDRVQAAPDIAYVFGASIRAFLWRRSGTTWTRITSIPVIDISQAWYDWFVAARPDDKNEVYLGAIDTFKGRLSGSSWTFKDVTTQGNNSIHPDQHCLTFSPDDSRIIYAGNDGGIYRSANGGTTWKALNDGLGITEIEYLGSDPNTWKWLIAGTQDNGTIRFTGDTVWEHIADGDGGDCGVNQLSPNTVYHSYFDVTLERSNNKGDTWTDLAPTSMAALFYPPVEVSGMTVAIGGASLVVTRNGAAPWTTVSLGLAAGDLATAMRAIDANTLVVGTQAGRVVKVAWNGSAWAKSTLTSPTPRYISCIAVDPSNPTRYWATISQMGGPMVYRSDNGGGTWVASTSGLPKIPMNSVVVDPANFKRVWVAADVGVYQTTDLGASWSLFSSGLPNAMAVDLLFHKQDRMLICGTRNRGAWVIAV